MTVFGDRTFKEVIKVKRGHWGGFSPSVTGFLKEGEVRTRTHTEGQPCGDTEKTVVYKPRREASGGPVL